MVWVLGFVVRDFRFRVQELGFRIWGLPILYENNLNLKVLPISGGNVSNDPVKLKSVNGFVKQN